MARNKTTRPGATEGGLVKPALLSGGNPQIPKADGDAAVQAYIAAMPGWKSLVGKPLDTLIERIVRDVQKAVKWNSTLYGTAEHGWFLGVHCFSRYVKIAFFNGAALDPLPPVTSKEEKTRYVHIDENVCTAVRKPSSGAPAFVPARAA